MVRYRIEHRYPCYANGGCIPHDGYFVQKLKEGLFTDKWVDIKGNVFVHKLQHALRLCDVDKEIIIKED